MTPFREKKVPKMRKTRKKENMSLIIDRRKKSKNYKVKMKNMINRTILVKVSQTLKVLMMVIMKKK